MIKKESKQRPDSGRTRLFAFYPENAPLATRHTFIPYKRTSAV